MWWCRSSPPPECGSCARRLGRHRGSRQRSRRHTTRSTCWGGRTRGRRGRCCVRPCCRSRRTCGGASRLRRARLAFPFTHADAQQRLAEAAAAAVAHGYAGALTLHPEAAGACNAAFPGSAARTGPAPAAPSPSPWQPVVPSHFGIGVKAVAAPAAPTTAMPAARNAKRRVQPNVAPPASPSGPSAWQPVVPSHFGYRVAPREPDGATSADGGGAGVASPEESPTREES